MRLFSLNILLITLSCLPLWADEFVVLKVIQNNSLNYRILNKAEATKTKADLKKEKVKFTQLKGTFSSEEEAKAQTQKDSDITGFFTCWKCDGAGSLGGGDAEVSDEGEENPKKKKKAKKKKKNKAAKCKICAGKKYIKSKGYVVIMLKTKENWGYALIRKSMLSEIQKKFKGATVKPTKTFKPGEFTKAEEALKNLQEKANGKKGYDQSSTASVPTLQWPSEFVAKA